MNEVDPGAGDLVLSIPVVLASTPWFINDISRQIQDAQTILDLQAALKSAPAK